MPELHDPSLPVHVWVVMSLLVVVTVPPRATVTDGGWNAKPLIEMAAAIGPAGAVVAGGSVVAGSVGAGWVSGGSVPGAPTVVGVEEVVVAASVVVGGAVVVVDVVVAEVVGAADAAVFDGDPPPHALRRSAMAMTRATVVRPRAEMGTDPCTGGPRARIAGPG